MAGDAAQIDLEELRTLAVDRSPNVAGRRVFVLHDFTTERVALNEYSDHEMRVSSR